MDGDRNIGPTGEQGGKGLRGVERAGASDEATAAVLSFLADFGLDPKENDASLNTILGGVCVDRQACPHGSEAACALHHAEERFEAWLARVLGPETTAGHPALPIGRAAFLACDGPAAFSELVLVDDDLPEAFVAAMRTASPSLAPMPTPGPMAAQALDSWSLADIVHTLAEALGGSVGWAAGARLITTSVKPDKPIP